MVSSSFSSFSSFDGANQSYNHLVNTNYFHIPDDNYMISIINDILTPSGEGGDLNFIDDLSANDTNGTDAESRIYYSNPEEMLSPWDANDLFYPTVITNILTFIFGVSGNSVVIWFMLGDKANRSVTSIFLVSLAISDLLLLAIVAPLDVAHYFVAQWDVDGKVCKVAAYAESVSAFASILNLVAVTFERFVVIVFPLRSRSLCTIENCKNFVILVWVLAILFALPTIAIKEVTQSTYYNNQISITLYLCKETRGETGLRLSIYRFIFLFALPSILMIVLYTWVIVELWISTRTMDELTNNS